MTSAATKATFVSALTLRGMLREMYWPVKKEHFPMAASRVFKSATQRATAQVCRVNVIIISQGHMSDLWVSMLNKYSKKKI